MQEFLYKLQLVRGDMLRTGPTAVEQAVVAEHFAHLQGLHAKGTIIFVGRTLTTDENTMGLAVFRAESEEAARRIMNDDPAVKKRVMTAMLYPFKVVLQELKTENSK
ncbi:MAG: YciI family protein [Terriglobales bacterium]